MIHSGTELAIGRGGAISDRRLLTDKRRTKSESAQMPPVASPSAARARVHDLQDLMETLNRELDPELGARIARADRPRDDAGTPPLTSGLPQIDALIGGGFPRGALCEICGPASSGRTSLGLSLLAQLTRAGDYVAWIDAADAFDPPSAEAAGVELERVLWVRAPDPMAALRCGERVLETEGFGLVGLDLSNAAVRIPEAAWLRLTRRVAGKHLPLLLLSDERLAGPRATLALEMVPGDARFTGTPRLLEPLEPLSFVLRGMLSRVTERLVLRGLASGPIDLAFELCGGARDHRRIGVAAPTRDHRVLLRLVVQALESQPPEAPIEAIALSTVGRVPRSDQLDLFRNPGPDPAEIDRTLAELEALCGPGQVGAPAVVDDNHPCAFELKPFSPDTGATRVESDTLVADRPENPGAYGRFAVRALRPPVRAEVQLRGGQPGRIRSAVACGEVLGVAGPWRTTGRWWSEEGRFALDHFDIQVSDGTILRLCFDWIARSWQIDAIYD